MHCLLIFGLSLTLIYLANISICSQALGLPSICILTKVQKWIPKSKWYITVHTNYRTLFQSQKRMAFYFLAVGEQKSSQFSLSFFESVSLKTASQSLLCYSPFMGPEILEYICERKVHYQKQTTTGTNVAIQFSLQSQVHHVICNRTNITFH